MSILWDIFVGYLQEGLFGFASLYGGNIGLAIISLSALVRLLLMPLAIRITLKNKKKQAILKSLQPELDKLKKRYKNHPDKLSAKTMELYKKNGIKLVDGSGFLSSLIQIPFFAGMFSAIRQAVGYSGSFLWIPNISQPNMILTFIVAGLTFASSLLSANNQEQGGIWVVILPTALTLFFVWRLSAGLGLYMATSSLVSLVQTGIIRRKFAKQQ